MNVIDCFRVSFNYLPKLQLRISIQVLDKHGMLPFFLCGSLSILACMLLWSPLALLPTGLTGVGALLAFLYALVVWVQVMIPWVFVIAIIKERSSHHKDFSESNSWLQRARRWAWSE